ASRGRQSRREDRRRHRARRRARAPARDLGALSRPEGEHAIREIVRRARGHREPHRRGAHALQRRGPSLQHHAAHVPDVVVGRMVRLHAREVLRGAARREGSSEGRLRGRRALIHPSRAPRVVCASPMRRYGWSMHTALRLIGAGLAAGLLAACDGGTPPDAQRAAALTSRIDALEQRLAAAEKAGEPIERLRNDAASLDRRVTSLETNVRELAGGRPAPAAAPPTPPPTHQSAAPNRPAPSRGPAAWNNPTTRADRSVRRAELRALSDEFRTRLSEMRAQPG